MVPLIESIDLIISLSRQSLNATTIVFSFDLIDKNSTLLMLSQLFYRGRVTFSAPSVSAEALKSRKPYLLPPGLPPVGQGLYFSYPIFRLHRLLVTMLLVMHLDR